MDELYVSTRRFENLKILYVDDEPENLESFQINFEEEFDVLTSADPEEARNILLGETDMAVLLVDQVMPKLTGLQLAQEVKKKKPNLACIMITGNATKRLAIESVKSNLFLDFLEKPIDFSSAEMRQILINGIQEHLLLRTKNEYHQGTVNLIANLIDAKDGHTHSHSSRVTKWALKVGRKFDLSEKELLQLREGSLLHDIGKIGIPDDILKKPGRLSPLERKVMMSHPSRGADLLEKVPQLKDLGPIARYHHERPDGTGYPEGLLGDQIPILAAIVSIADFFEALSSKRPYKDPWPLPNIIKEVQLNRGTQFAEEIADALFAVLEEEGMIEREDLRRIREEAA